MGACKHRVVPAQGKGRQQQKDQALLHIRKADPMLGAGVWLTPVCISCTEKSPLQPHSTNPSHDKFSRQKLTLTETTDVNTTPSTQVQTHHDIPGYVQQWEQTDMGIS